MRVRHLGLLPCAFVASDPEISKVELTEEQLMKSFWGLKRWRATGSLSDNGAAPATGVWDFINTNYNVMSGTVINPATEEEIALADTTTHIDTSGPLGFLGFWSYVNAYLAFGFWNLQLDITMTSGTGVTTTDDTNTQPSAVAGSFMGEPFEFQEIIGQGPFTGSLSIEPLEYWEYRKASGAAPIYNPAGAELIDPRQDDELLVIP